MSDRRDPNELAAALADAELLLDIWLFTGEMPAWGIVKAVHDSARRALGLAYYPERDAAHQRNAPASHGKWTIECPRV